MKGTNELKLGDKYIEEKQYDKALAQFLLSSEQGNYFATYNDACMYYFGDGVTQDEAKAFEYFSKARSQGDAEATNRMAAMLAEGVGVKKDLIKAFDLYLEAAKNKSLSAMANVAICYLEGMGTSIDINEGLKWLDEASLKGNGVASKIFADYYFVIVICFKLL